LRAIILAAGRGTRMGGLTDAIPKCLVKLGGRALLEWQLAALRDARVTRIAIVTGWPAVQLENRGAETFHNPRWAETNMVMSLACAREWLEADTCIVSYSDIFYPSSAVRALLTSPGDISMTYDPNWLALWSRRFPDPLADAESFEIDSDGRVTDIGRRVDDVGKIKGQYMGLLKFTPQGWTRADKLIAALPERDRNKLDMTTLLQRLIAAGESVKATPISGPWGEVDSESDLALYSNEFDLDSPNTGAQ